MKVLSLKSIFLVLLLAIFAIIGLFACSFGVSNMMESSQHLNSITSKSMNKIVEFILDIPSGKKYSSITLVGVAEVNNLLRKSNIGMNLNYSIIMWQNNTTVQNITKFGKKYTASFPKKSIYSRQIVFFKEKILNTDSIQVNIRSTIDCLQMYGIYYTSILINKKIDEYIMFFKGFFSLSSFSLFVFFRNNDIKVKLLLLILALSTAPLDAIFIDSLISQASPLILCMFLLYFRCFSMMSNIDSMIQHDYQKLIIIILIFVMVPCFQFLEYVHITKGEHPFGNNFHPTNERDFFSNGLYYLALSILSINLLILVFLKAANAPSLQMYVESIILGIPIFPGLLLSQAYNYEFFIFGKYMPKNQLEFFYSVSNLMSAVLFSMIDTIRLQTDEEIPFLAKKQINM